MNQRSFASAEYVMKKKRTRRGKFLFEYESAAAGPLLLQCQPFRLLSDSYLVVHHMKRLFTLIIICAGFIAAPSEATDKAVQECADTAEQSLAKMLATLDETARLLPKIPPSEAQFFEIQSSAFDKIRHEEYKSPNWAKPGATDDDEKSIAIYETFAHRPLYNAWNFHKNQLIRFRSDILDITDPKSTWAVTFPDDRDAEQANRAVRLIDTTNDYIWNVDQYLDHNENLKT